MCAFVREYLYVAHKERNNKRTNGNQPLKNHWGQTLRGPVKGG